MIPKFFSEYSNMDNFSENINEYIPNKKHKMLTVLDDMIFDILNNTELNLIVIPIFITGRKLNILFVFITQSHFAVPTNIRLNSTHHFIMKIANTEVVLRRCS